MAVTNTTTKTYVSFPITKFEQTDDGHLMVYGKATDPSIDSDRQSIKSEWSGQALKEWMETGANIRVQHQARRDPAGKGVGLEVNRDGDGGHWLKALVVEPVAKDLVRHGVLRAFSVGIADPVIERDMSGKAAGGLITGGSLFEISLVDRPANKNCGFTLAKSAGDGADEEWEDYGDFDSLLYEAKSAELSKAEDGASPDSDDDSTGDDFDPADDGDDDKKKDEREKAYREARAAWRAAEPSLAKAAGPTEYLQARAAYQRWLAEGEGEGVADGSYGTAAGMAQFVAKRNFDSGVGGGVDRDKIPAADFGDPANRKYPIVTPDDVGDAAGLVGHAADPDAVKARIIAIAKRKGAAFVAKLPASWNVKSEEHEDALEKAKKKKPAFDGAAKPFGGKDDDEDADKPTKTKDAEPADAAEKAGGKTCPKCGKVYHMDTKVKACTSCGTKLPKGKAIKAAFFEELLQKVGDGLISLEDARAELGKSPWGLPGAAEKAKRPLPADTKPAGAHREPDGTLVEGLEQMAGLPTDPDDKKDVIPSSVKDDEPVSYSAKRMHDVFCSAYHEDDVRAEYPSLKNLADAADEAHWTRELTRATEAADALAIGELTLVLRSAQALKASDPLAVADARALMHKAFSDLYPNTAKPTPTDMTPGKFQRPYISGGHAPLTATGATPRVPPSTHTPEPEDFQRGLITTGHQAKPPAAKGDGNNPNGYNARDYYGPAAREAAANYMKSQHDRLAASQPDLCPMTPNRSVMPPDLSAGSTPHAASMPQTYAAPGEKSVDNPDVVTLLKALLAQGEKQNKKITKALDSRLVEANEKIEELRQQLDQLGSQPDPAQAPVRGVVRKSAVHETEAAPVERRSLVDEAQQHIEQERQQRLEYLTRLTKSGDPNMRHKAEDAIERLLLEKAE